MKLRAALTSVFVVGLIGFSAPAGAADLDIDRLPTVDDDTVAALVTDIDLDGLVSDIDLKGLVVDLELETTEGTQTVVTLDSDILFAFGESTLPPSAPARIGEIVMDVPSGATVSVGGHTDDVGADDANQTLSKSRADAVAAVIAAARSDLKLTVTGFGETMPIEANRSGGKDNPEGRSRNRRVEIRYTS